MQVRSRRLRRCRTVRVRCPVRHPRLTVRLHMRVQRDSRVALKRSDGGRRCGRRSAAASPVVGSVRESLGRDLRRRRLGPRRSQGGRLSVRRFKGKRLVACACGSDMGGDQPTLGEQGASSLLWDYAPFMPSQRARLLLVALRLVRVGDRVCPRLC